MLFSWKAKQTTKQSGFQIYFDALKLLQLSEEKNGAEGKLNYL